jgi:hypothetical protein
MFLLVSGHIPTEGLLELLCVKDGNFSRKQKDDTEAATWGCLQLTILS